MARTYDAGQRPEWAGACALVKESEDLISRCGLMMSNTAEDPVIEAYHVILRLHLLHTI